MAVERAFVQVVVDHLWLLCGMVMVRSRKPVPSARSCDKPIRSRRNDQAEHRPQQPGSGYLVPVGMALVHQPIDLVDVAVGERRTPPIEKVLPWIHTRCTLIEPCHTLSTQHLGHADLRR
jgi:hypothetical protein